MSRVVREIEAENLASYVKSGFGRINRALRSGHPNASSMELIELVDGELDAMPQATVATTYRVGGLLTEYRFADLQAGKTFQDLAFYSTSTDPGIFDRYGARKGKVLFTIQLLTGGFTAGRDLAGLKGAKEFEKEVLFPRSTPFLITSYENPKWRSGIYVTMKEMRITGMI